MRLSQCRLASLMWRSASGTDQAYLSSDRHRLELVDWLRSQLLEMESPYQRPPFGLKIMKT